MVARSVGLGRQEAAAHPPDFAAVGQDTAVMAVNPVFVFLEARLQMARVDPPLATPYAAPMPGERVVHLQVFAVQTKPTAAMNACKFN